MVQACAYHPIVQQSGWMQAASVLQAWLTPVLAFATIVLGIATVLIQRRQSQSARVQAESAKAQAESARVQAETNHLQYRLALFERRMKVLNATMNLIRVVLRDAKVETQQLFQLIIDTREHEFLFGQEIGDYIYEVYHRGVDLHAAAPGVARGEHEAIERETESLRWFSQEVQNASQRFLPYLDFRQP